MRKSKIHAFTIIIGLLLAAAIVCSHVFQMERAQVAKQKVNSEQKTKEDSEKNRAFFSAPTITTPPSSAHVQLNIVTYCLFQFCQPKEKVEVPLSEFHFKPQKFLLTLFRVIISPNAP